jgi:oxygen-dependent protoporphyrinogen oxidase
VRVFLGGAHRPELVDRDDRELTALAHSELRILLGVTGEPLETHITRWRQSMPQYHVGHVSLVDSIEERVAAHRGLVLAGNGYRGVGIPQCIQSGRLAAERIASVVGQSA